MDRKFEKNLIRIAAVWNLISGIMTMFFYSSWVISQGLDVDKTAMINNRANHVLIDNLYTFTHIFGLFFILLGIISLMISNKISTDKVSMRIIIWLIFCSLVSYLCIDIIGALIYITSIVIIFSKNQAVKKLKQANG